MEIRKALKTDINAMLPIEQANFGARAFSRRQFEGYIKKGHTYVVCHHGTVVGYCVVFVRSNSRTARINVLSISPAVIGQGHGTFLIEAIHDMYCLYDKVQLEVNVLNYKAIKLYERLGYEPVAVLPNYYGEGTTAIKMIKPLQ